MARDRLDDCVYPDKSDIFFLLHDERTLKRRSSATLDVEEMPKLSLTPIKPVCTLNMRRRDLRSHTASARRASVRLTELNGDGKNDNAEQNSDKNALLDPSTCGRLDIRFRSKMSYCRHAMCKSEEAAICQGWVTRNAG
ncbi:uncharacterized protein ARMOST_20256 [Armillaria ostoyae]|uniref:Uncharacterized protein n=1 Tax=Armillaria ostoyae TaxID=47428 RepID=A0A284S6T7_ARMOS|nr:uncharacterized protein ARMOST_20256 [Armillaria ostoyae]